MLLLAGVAGVAVPAAADQAVQTLGDPTLVMTRAGDTVASIARRHDVGMAALVAANPGLDPDEFELNIVRVPAQHVLPMPHADVVVNLAELRLYVWREPGRTPVTMPIGQGRDCIAMATGTGALERDGGAWRLAGRNVHIAPAVAPETVGTRAGAGCIELYPEDFVRLAFHARAGQRVTVIDQPVKAARTAEGLLLEVHADASGRRHASDYAVAVAVLAACSEQSWEVDWQAVRTVTEEARGVPTDVLRVSAE